MGSEVHSNPINPTSIYIHAVKARKKASKQYIQVDRRAGRLGKTGELWVEGLLDCVHDVTTALAFSRTTTDVDVHTTSRLAQWRILNLPSSSSRKSHPFRLGHWNWHLGVETNRNLLIKLYPEPSNFTKHNPPFASFIIRLVSLLGDRNALAHPEITDKLLKNTNDFVWTLELPLTGKFIIDVEFLDLKTPATPSGGELCSIWAQGCAEKESKATAVVCLGRMLSESIHMDIAINLCDGTSIGAHRAVLASRSPVFRSMFLHDLKEKELSTINISDMSFQACQAFLNYMYGSIQHTEFLNHRLPLLRAADKYDISDLKEACHESLLQDIDAKNVLERLQNAYLYRLPKLKMSCMQYLVKFGKIFDITHEFNAFMQCADREIIADIFNEVLGAWKGL